MESSAEEIRQSFAKRVKRLADLVKETSALRQKGLLTERSLDAVYESAILDLYAAFEQFIEELFYSSTLQASGLSDVSQRLPLATREHVELALLRKNEYLTWLPFKENVRELAERYLQGGLPFARLDRHPNELAVLEEIRKVRNSVAHDSASAKSKIESLTSQLRPYRRHVAGHLQLVKQGRTVQETYAQSLLAIASSLTAPTRKDAQLYLSPETPFDSGKEAPKGRYVCVLCGKTHRVTRKLDRLPKCVSYHQGKTPWRRVY